MTRRIARISLACALATLVVLAGAKMVGATGYWNVPSNFGQWCGCGFGGGYHAPLMLGPPTHDCFMPPNEVRLPYAPNPYACAPYCNGACAGAPAMMTPNLQPAVVPQNATPAPAQQEELPAEQPHAVLFGPPVGR